MRSHVQNEKGRGKEREIQFDSHIVQVSDIFIAFCSYLSTTTTTTTMMTTKTTAINKKAAQNYPSRYFSGTIPLANCFIFRVLSSIYSFFLSCRAGDCFLIVLLCYIAMPNQITLNKKDHPKDG